MKSFKDDIELLNFVKDFIGEKLSSLEKDVNHCLVYPYAEFPAILYCFSIIDLLGSLYCGEAHSRSNTSKNAEKYMKDMMNYSEDQCQLLQQVFRHKIVHLAGPRAVYEYKGNRITWHYWHDSRYRHLTLQFLSSKGFIQPEHTKIRHGCTHYFYIGIKQLTEDIIQSFQGPNGYYENLKADPTLKKKFDDAVYEMFSPDK
jgi:hypothetical protein